MRIAAASFLFAAALCQPHPAGRGDAAKLKGTWVLVSVEAGGQKAAGADFRDFADRFSLTFNGESFSSTIPDGDYKGTLRLDGRTQPAEITMVREKGGEARGIYRFDGDQLVLCTGKPDDPRPTRFATTADNRAILMVPKRKSKYDPVTAADRRLNGACPVARHRGPPRPTGTADPDRHGFSPPLEGGVPVQAVPLAAPKRDCIQLSCALANTTAAGTFPLPLSGLLPWLARRGI